MAADYSREERAQLIEIARSSIEHGLEFKRPLPIDPGDYPEHLQELRACFVTLRVLGELRGCTGSIEPHAPLVRCVADHAFSSAFRDLRFAPLRRAELARLSLHISVLSPLLPLRFADEGELISQIRPGIDGLLLELGNLVGTLLPSVWRSISDPREFVRQLKRKAGLEGGYWSDQIVVSRYTAEEFGDPE